MSRTLTLALDCSSEELFAALLGPEKSLVELTLALDEPHSRTLMAAVERLLDLAGVEPASVGALFVGRGPGSFSSLRIGLAAMQGLAQGLECPLYTFVGLDLQAAGFSFWPGPAAVLTDARRGQVYWALYHFSADRPVRETPYRVADPEAVAEFLAPRQNLLLAGRGVDLYGELFARRLPDARLAGAALARPRLERLLGFPRRENESDAAGPGPAVLVRAGKQASPLYIRPSDAELNRRKKLATGDTDE